MGEADDEQKLDRKMDALLAGIWEKSKPVMAKRVALLRAASETIQSKGALPADEHEAAIFAAHNLAGVLGTFGFQDGTEAARSIESILFGRQATLADAEVLASMVATLEEVMQR